MQTPSIHISENPLTNNCTCLNHTKSLKNERYLCQIHQTDRLASHNLNHFYNTQQTNQYLTNANGQIQLNPILNQTNQFNQLNQRNSNANIPLNLIKTPSKTPSKESIYQQSDFSPHTCLPPIESPSVISISKCESIAASFLQHQQQQLHANLTPKRPSFAQNIISNSSTSNNLMATRQDRLFSVGPSRFLLSKIKIKIKINFKLIKLRLSYSI